MYILIIQFMICVCIVYRNPLVLLQNVLKGVGHENSDVRSSALCTLNKLLLEYKVNTWGNLTSV